MRLHLSTAVVLVVVCIGATVPAAQKVPAVEKASNAPAKKNPLLKLAEPWPDPEELKAHKEAAEARPLFQTPTPLEFTLTSAFSEINKDHNPESTKRYPGVLTVNGQDGAPRNIKVKLSARGHFRRMARNCNVVPLRVEFDKTDTAGTVFDGQTTLKLGTGCEYSKEFEQYTLREYLAYPIFGVVTPLSFRARLGRATYVDEKSQKKSGPRYAIFIEHENDVARRVGGRIVELQRVVFKDVDQSALVRAMLFEYMIGNTDMSIYALHNFRLVQTPTRTILTVPYDFDLSGFVHAPYAIPDRRLGLRTVQDRLYRGPCVTAEEFDAAAADFRAKQADILSLVESMRDMDPIGRGEAKAYLESFFRAIEKPESVRKNFVNGCKAQPTM